MATPIGFQSGVEAARARMKRLDPGGFNTQGTGAWDKFFNSIATLVHDHDAVLRPEPPQPPKPPEPPAQTYLKVAPRVAYEQGGSNARFLLYVQGGGLQPGVYQRPDGKYSDESRAVYTDLDGREDSNVRSPGPAATGAREMDNRELHDLPLTGDPTKNTGSWAV